ncbi:aldo/keto reductase [Arthrobacter sp. NPDC090010]|uniref:aldo/keto reductase n=1 Tax=Arthrobacter sp. NPDC090010 TaxID=3363942 RepID=UPI00380D0A64
MHFGTRVSVSDSHRLLDAAIECGVTQWDTANNYSFWASNGTGDESELTLGAWFSAHPGARDHVTIATKVGARPSPGSRSLDSVLGLSAPSIRSQVEGSLRRLRLDHVDLLYAHIDDHTVPLEETIEALQGEVLRGTARAIGCSNISAGRLRSALQVSDDGPRYSVVQNRFSYLTRPQGSDLGRQVVLDGDCAETARSHRMSIVGYSPLLEGAYTRGDREFPRPYRHAQHRKQLASLAQASAATGLDPGQIVLAWMTQRTVPVIPVIGASTAEQIKTAVAALQMRLPDEIVTRLDADRELGND